jgi:hypothetical protein
LRGLIQRHNSGLDSLSTLTMRFTVTDVGIGELETSSCNRQDDLLFDVISKVHVWSTSGFVFASG